MDVGYIIKYGRIVPGREEKANELFTETLTFWRKQLAEGAITFFEPFLYASGDREVNGGFFLIKGYDHKLRAITELEDYRVLVTKALYVVEHFQTEWLLAGDEVMAQVERWAKVAPEFALAH